uniref:Chromosome (Plasmid) partitioning protein ParB n=1 Tax=Klebsiella pneumoniae TaxID=573 RepID=A0A482M6W1_KLEPN|nr:Chromosome (plasmid) partitioning protein ParB [Klebsiella pneumoniae]
MSEGERPEDEQKASILKLISQASQALIDPSPKEKSVVPHSVLLKKRTSSRVSV